MEEKRLSNFYAKNLRKQIFRDGKCVYERPSIEEIKAYCASQMDTLWDETKRFENPQTYYVDLSYDLWKMKHDMIESISK